MNNLMYRTISAIALCVIAANLTYANLSVPSSTQTTLSETTSEVVEVVGVVTSGYGRSGVLVKTSSGLQVIDVTEGTVLHGMVTELLNGKPLLSQPRFFETRGPGHHEVVRVIFNHQYHPL